MSNTPDDSKIRDRAYALWQLAGSPEGDRQHYWSQAERELSEEAGLDTSEEQAKVKQPPLVAGTLAR